MSSISKPAIVAAGILLVLGALFSNAFELGLSADAVSASSCSNGVVQAWVSGAAPGGNAYFSAETGYASANLGNPSAIVSSSGTALSTIIVSVPQCSLGSHLITVTAQVCQAGGNCETQGRKLLVNAQQCEGVQCANTYSTVESKILYPSPAPTSYCGSAPCAEVQSTIVREGYYYQARYAGMLETTASPRCLAGYCSRDQLKAGETIALQLFARNAGAAGSFEVRVDTASANIVVLPKSVSFEMARGERVATDFFASARQPGFPGSYSITFSLWHNGQKLDELTQLIDVVQATPSGESARLVLPPGVGLSACSLPPQAAIPATLHNPGASQQFFVNAQLRGQAAYSQAITVAGGAAQLFQIAFASTRLLQGDNWIDVSASSSEFEGSGRINVAVAPCAVSEEKLGVKSVFSNESGNRIEVVSLVRNDGTAPLERVGGELLGLPDGWKQASETLSLAPGEEKNLTIVVLATGGEVVKPTLVVKNDGKIIATRQLGELNRRPDSGLTGFFALGDSALVALIVVLMALAAALMFAASSENDASRKNLQATRNLRAGKAA